MLQRLVDQGNSVVVIEHNLDVIKTADWVLDLGPEGGVRGGEVVAEGTPEAVAAEARSFTGSYLAPMLAKSEERVTERVGYVGMVESVLEGKGTLRFERSSPTGVSVQNFLERALVIARAIGWDKPANDPLRNAYKAVLQAAISEGGMALVRFARLGLRYGACDVGDEIGDIDAKAENATQAKEFHDAIALQELANSIAARENEGEIPTEGRLRLAKIHESQADASEGSSFLQTHALQSAIDALLPIIGRESWVSIKPKLEKYTEF